MLMDALALRDRTTSRHATAVARYAQALAIELGCDEEEQEVVHTAGLLHDIGKFTWSDRVLHPEQLTRRGLGGDPAATRRTAPRWSASSTATARSPTRSSTTTSASTAAATRPG